MLQKKNINLIGTLFLLYFLSLSSFAQIPVWRFSVIAGISDATVNHYGGFEATKSLVLQQFITVNEKFNTPNVFNGTFEFAVDSIYQFSGDPGNEISIPDPNFNYRVIYDAFPTQGGGWFGQINCIYHSWSWDFFNGIFGAAATDGITHEFGHSRGAIDLYALEVQLIDNLVNNQSYTEAISIMNYPYGESIWDKHSINIINLNAGIVIENCDYITNAFPPSIGINVFDTQGHPIQDAEIKIYPIEWYQNSVTTTPLYSVTTNSQGEYIFSENPFGPDSLDYPWYIRYPCFLISAEINSVLHYKFMPITTVQNFYFDHPDEPYKLSFGTSMSTGINDDNLTLKYSLFQNYPNPFNTSTKISFYIPKVSFVTLNIYTMRGQKIATIVNEKLQPGLYEKEWKPDNLINSVYFYQLSALYTKDGVKKEFKNTKKLILLK